jgi:hypothetical protein
MAVVHKPTISKRLLSPFEGEGFESTERPEKRMRLDTASGSSVEIGSTANQSANHKISDASDTESFDDYDPYFDTLDVPP